MITLGNINMDNIAVSFDNECGLPVKELIKILSRKKYQDGNAKLVVTENGLAIVAWIDRERKPPCPHINTIDQGPDGVLCTDCGETVTP